MSEGRKISIRKIIQTLVTILLLAVCVFTLLSTSKIQDKRNIKTVKIQIQNENYCRFVSKEEIEKTLFENRHIVPTKLKFEEVDLKKMEAILMTNPWVKHAQVFVDNQNCLNITVVQRVPQIRVFERTGNSYYIDTAQDILPLSDNYNHYELLFVNVPTITNDSLGESLKSKMLSIAKNIKSNKFWNAQTAQVVVNNSQDFQLITILGNQKILLGDTNDLDNKLENLLVFYQKIQNKIGWDKYEVLDARFQNQIVASPSLPWNVPIDRALTNMNWVKTIVGDIPIQEAPSAFPLSTDASAVLDKVPVKQQVKIDSQANKNNRKPL